MKINKMKDERIVQLNNKIQSEAFILTIMILALSIFIKSYIFDMTYRSYRRFTSKGNQEYSGYYC